MDLASLRSFWDMTLDRLAKEPIAAEVVRLDQKEPYAKHRVTLRGLDGVRFRAYLAIPCFVEPASRPLPAIVTAPGYSGWAVSLTLSESQRGYVILQVFPRSQGESAELWKVQPDAYQAWVNHGKHNPDGFYYQGAYTDIIRGIDYLLTRPDVDADRVGLWGASQGGGIVLSCGALDPRVKAVAADVPYLCNVRHNDAFKSCPDLINDPVFLDTFDFFDPVNLAPWLNAPSIVSSGGKDATCPAATIRAVWDRLQGIKTLYHDPEMGHDSSATFYRMAWDWMDQFIARR